MKEPVNNWLRLFFFLSSTAVLMNKDLHNAHLSCVLERRFRLAAKLKVVGYPRPPVEQTEMQFFKRIMFKK